MSWQCRYCHELFDDDCMPSASAKANHTRWCNDNPKRKEYSQALIKVRQVKTNFRNQWSGLSIKEIPFKKLGYGRQRIRVLMEANFKCEECSFDQTRSDGTSILQIDHIDGNNTNNSRANLRVLCPNCHALTKTWGFKGRKHSSNSCKKISDANRQAHARIKIISL